MRAGKEVMAKPSSWQDLQDDVALRLWDGDESVLKTILQYYAPALIKCLHAKYAQTLTLEDVEEVVGDAIRILWADRKNYDDKKATVWTWLYRIADYDAQDLVAKGWQRVRRREATGVDMMLAERPVRRIPGRSLKPDKQRQRLFTDVRQVVEALSDAQRVILVAKAMAPDGEVTAGKLAEELGMPEATVRVYLMRARETAKRELAKRGHHLPQKGGSQ
jgi:RNA polymerase sigma factor (sigma-70 family)